jgi:hypothetical protein
MKKHPPNRETSLGDKSVEFRFPELCLTQGRNQVECRPLLPTQNNPTKANTKDKHDFSPFPPMNPGWDPGLSGPIPVQIDHKIYFKPSSFPFYQNLYGYVYSPVGFAKLVLIFPAVGAGSPISAGYAELGRHLASHGFHVVTLQPQASYADTKEHIEAKFAQQISHTLHFLYTDPTSPLLGRIIGNEIAIIGHSQGGRKAMKNAKVISHPVYGAAKILKSLILFSPEMEASEVDSLVPTIDEWFDSFLGIHPVTDSDPGTAGEKPSGKIMQTAFAVYDIIGNTPSPYVIKVEKDMIFIPTIDLYGHYFQNNQITKAFVAAFLHKHIYGNPFYDEMLKLQTKPPSIHQFATRIRQQHEERTDFRPVADFDHSIDTLDSIVTSNGVAVSVVEPWKGDPRSPHASRCLRISSIGIENFETWIMFKIKGYFVSGQFSHLTFRIGQSYQPNAQPLDMRVEMSSKSVLLSQTSGKIEPQIYSPAHDTGTGIIKEQTKNAMRTHVIPISAFPGLTYITYIKLDLTMNGPLKTLLYFDSLVFWQL